MVVEVLSGGALGGDLNGKPGVFSGAVGEALSRVLGGLGSRGCNIGGGRMGRGLRRG